MTQARTAAAGYFGKVPSRGDFVRTPGNHQLMMQLDRWAGGAIELLAGNPDWKRLYDDAQPVDFAFLGSRSRVAVCGHLAPSRDASGRRFPLLSAVRIDVADPLGFISRAPLAFSRTWNGLARHSAEAVLADDAGDALQGLEDARHELSLDPGAYAAGFDDFLQTQAIGSLQPLLREAGHGGLELRHALPALGLLMQPVLTGRGVVIDKSLELPLPDDALHRPLAASFWLDLVAGFLSRGEFELAVLLIGGPLPRLLLGFNGADPELLRATIDPGAADDHLIRIAGAGWVEEQIAGDYALNRLASYLDRDALTLKSARAVFRETFLGA